MTPHIPTGVEMELWVVDRRGQLTGGQDLADAHDRIGTEFVDPMLEVRTEPHESAAGLRDDLLEVLGAALDAAAANGKRLVSLGTPLSAVEAPANCERGRLFEKIYGDGIVSAKNCAGTHVHFEKTDVVDQLNLLTALDPALALVSSSPYYLGVRGEDCSRAVAYREKCGPAFRRFCALWPYTESVDEWESRVEEAYEAFQDLAVGRGVSRDRVEEFFDPENTVLNPVRLRHEQPTVEWRAPDSALPSQILALAGDIGTLVGRLESTDLGYGSPGVDDGGIRLPEFSNLESLGREAMHDGLSSDRVRTYLRRMGLNPGAYQPISQQLYGPSSVDEPTACKLRLEYARRLRDDVESLSSEPVSPDARQEVKI